MGLELEIGTLRRSLAVKYLYITGLWHINIAILQYCIAILQCSGKHTRFGSKYLWHARLYMQYECVFF